MFTSRFFVNTKFATLPRKLTKQWSVGNVRYTRSMTNNYKWDELVVPKCNNLKTCQNFVRRTHQEAILTENSEMEDESKGNLTINEKREQYWHRNKILSIDGYEEILVPSPYEKDAPESLVQQLLKDDWKLMTAEQLVSNFEILTSYIYRSFHQSQKVEYEHILTDVATNLPYLSRSQLEAVLRQYQLLKLDNPKPANQQFLKSLDKDLRMRLSDLTLAQKLKFCDLLNVAGVLHKEMPVFQKMMKQCSNKVHQMSQQQIVHFSYLLISMLTSPQHMYELEYEVSKYIDSMSISEVSIICLCFFKRQYQPKDNKILNTILTKAIHSVDEMESYHVSSIMKFFRSFRKVEAMKGFQHLLTKLRQKIDDFGDPALTHIAQAAANNATYDPVIMEQIIQRVINNMENFRLKDLERLSFALNTFSYKPPQPIFPTMVQEWNKYFMGDREEKIKPLKSRYLKAIPISCMYLGQLGYYNLPMLENIMQPDFIKKAYGDLSYNMSLEYFWLDQSIEIELPEYKGPRLAEKASLRMQKFFAPKIPSFEADKMNAYYTTIHNLFKECQKLAGKKSVTVTSLLPHYNKPDLVIAVDKNNRTLPTEDIISKDLTIKYIPEEYKKDITWFVFIMGNPFCRILNSKTPTGFVKSKIRQLERLGYTPIVIFNEEWNNLTKEKGQYLQSILFESEKRPPCNDQLFIDNTIPS